MTIDWNHFTPWMSLSGGILLGIAAAVFILVHGRILGISGILGGFLTLNTGDAGWRTAFIWGMLAAPLTLGLAGFCPGPAIVSVAMGEWKTLVFVIAMIAGMLLFTLSKRLGKHTIAAD